MRFCHIEINKLKSCEIYHTLFAIIVKLVYNNFYIMFIKHDFTAPLVQLVERKSPKFDVEGSSPSGRA